MATKPQNAKVKISKSAQVNYAAQIAPKSIARTRQDVRSWNTALTNARKADNPKRWQLYNLYKEIMIDALLLSQISNRRRKSLAESFVIKDSKGKINEEVTNFLQNKQFVNCINTAILNAEYYGHSVIEFNYIDDLFKSTLLKRQNIDPVNGRFYPDYSEDKYINYRELPQYGTWILEFGDDEEGDYLGLLNTTVPHVLFKRFAQSCWSELCEIAGIPPRVMKTNTQDAAMVRRAERMMRDMGSAAWFIIDETEKFEWAEPNTSNGDVYNNLMRFCNNEISMVISGAIIGQDTKNGSRSKDESSQSVLADLVDSDLALLEQAWNDKVIPALINIGILKGDLVYGYPESEDIEAIHKKIIEYLPFFDVDPTFIEEKTGVKLLAKKQDALNNNLSFDDSFFV